MLWICNKLEIICDVKLCGDMDSCDIFNIMIFILSLEMYCNFFICDF